MIDEPLEKVTPLAAMITSQIRINEKRQDSLTQGW
jgi:hypothetical protein